jgi:Xaa-Pro aminopeptidase
MVEPDFSPDEYAHRIQETQRRMRDRALDLLFVADPANLNYLTGYDCWSFYSPQILVTPSTGDPLFYVREVDRTGAVLTSNLREDQVAAYPERYVQQRDVHPMDWVSEDMRERDLDFGTIAVEMESSAHTVRSHQALVAGLPGARIVDAENLVNWVRLVKSDAEVAKMRIAGQIATRVMATAVEMIAPGVRQCDLVAEVFRTGIRGLDDAGGDYPAIVPLLPTGEATGVPHVTWSDKPFVHGEATAIELAGCHQRYHCPLARTVFLGDPPKLLSRTAKVVEEGMEAALATVRPGVRADEVDAAWREVIARNGISKSGRIAYPVGLAYPPDWGERTISFRPGDTNELQPNMTFHMILGIWRDDWGHELSETFVVTESGAECLAEFPRDMVVKAP